MIDWITKNYQWIFSGIGVLLISMIANLIFKKRKQSQKITQNQNSGNNSVNIQTTKKIIIKDSFKK
jgi:predicted tellurium resistance membrane protein TerC